MVQERMASHGVSRFIQPLETAADVPSAIFVDAGLDAHFHSHSLSARLRPVAPTCHFFTGARSGIPVTMMLSTLYHFMSCLSTAIMILVVPGAPIRAPRSQILIDSKLIGEDRPRLLQLSRRLTSMSNLSSILLPL